MDIEADIVVAGAPARGPLLKLRAPISFWGGVDPATGRIVDARHPDFGASVAGTFLALPATIGSSSSSSILLELISRGLAPAAMILVDIDAILLIALSVSAEMDWPAPPALTMKSRNFALLPQGIYCLGKTGRLKLELSGHG